MVKVNVYFSTKYGTVDVEDECTREELTVVLGKLIGSIKIATVEMKVLRKVVDVEA